MKVSDYVADFLFRNGITQVFSVTGGGAMHLNDSLGHHPGLRVVYNHHEQACAMAAEGYARITNRPAVVNVTTGPGGINALNGVFGAWTDSIPMLVISGQVKRETCMASYPDMHIRQLGDQEADVISMVKGITKYAVLVEDSTTIRYHLEKALTLCSTGRPGPCWLDIPIDVQASQVPMDMSGYAAEVPGISEAGDLDVICADIVNRIKMARRPVIMVGKGVRQAGMGETFEKLIRRLSLPVVTAWTGIDLMGTHDPLFCGRPGDVGDRAGNFTVQNADLLLILGTRLSLRQVSYNWKSFARQAYKIHVEIDPAELAKPTTRIDMPVNANLAKVLPMLLANVEKSGLHGNSHADWLLWCRQRVARYPVYHEKHKTIMGKPINPYDFMHCLFRRLTVTDTVVCANGTANVVAFQTAILGAGQRMFCNTGDASMGYGLPASIGAATADHTKRLICLEGDGSLMMNLQELQTLVNLRLPVLVFVLNNGGYVSIRQSQTNFFKRLTGESIKSGVSFPDYFALGKAFGLPVFKVEGANFELTLCEVLKTPGPAICDVVLDGDQGFEPRLAAKLLPDGRIVSPPLEDMFPFLSREELGNNIVGINEV